MINCESKQQVTGAIKVISVPSAFQTTDATPTTFLSIPVSQQQAIGIFVYANIYTTNFANAEFQIISSSFRRATGGNVIRTTTIPSVDINGDYVGGNPAITLVANISTQSIDIIGTGKAATTINWIIEYKTLSNI